MGKKREIELLEKVVDMQEEKIKRLTGVLREKEAEDGMVKPSVGIIRDTSWATATVGTLVKMLREHYAGRLSIYDYWGSETKEMYIWAERSKRQCSLYLLICGFTD